MWQTVGSDDDAGSDGSDDDHGSKRSVNDSNSVSSSDSDSSRERDKKKKKKEKKHKHKKDKHKKDKKHKKEKKRKREKDSSSAAVDQNKYGMYGIIREDDQFKKQREFQAWLMEVKKVGSIDDAMIYDSIWVYSFEHSFGVFEINLGPWCARVKMGNTKLLPGVYGGLQHGHDATREVL